MIRLVCQKYISACFQKNSSILSIYHVVIPDHMIVGLESRGLIDFLSIHPPMVECLWKKNPDVIIKKSQMRRTKLHILAFWVHSHFSYRNLRLYLNKQIFLHSSLLLLYYYNCLFCEKSQFFNRHVWYRKRMSAKEKKFLPKKKFLHKMHQVQKIFCTDFSPAMCAFTKIPLRQYILYRVFFME